MSNNYDKIVKLACKPKNAPPKAKYVDVLISATYSEDGSINDIIRHLSLRLREPNAVVVFKALLTLHQMIRSGSTDQLMEQLAGGDSLRLRNVTGQNWEGYSPPSSLGAYANYLDTRIKVWRDLKHDLLKVQTESNRRSDGLGAASKARRLRHQSVEKGLLREVKGVQRILDSMVLCRFFDDDLKDDNTILAFRMLVKDLLVLFQAGNEGVCNILEHYFEMSKSDATQSFEIYKHFIKQTDRVVDYLGVARKLNNVLNVPVPNLKHAPTGLVKALEEYLNDPNFEENRREYRASLGVVEGRTKDRTPSPGAANQDKKPDVAPSTTPPASSATSALTAAPTSTDAGSSSNINPAASKKIQDFFDSIAADHQPTMFGGPAQAFPQAAQQQMQAPFNPFRASMMPQQTGFMQSQMTGFPGGGHFMQPQMTGQMAFGQPSQNMFQPQTGPSSFMQPQNTSVAGSSSPFGQAQFQSQFTGMPPGQSQQAPFLQPQPTGSNPFRQSTMLFNNAHPTGITSQPASPVGGQSQIPRPGSTPALSMMGQNQSNPDQARPLTAQTTDTKNPFAPAPGSQPAQKQQENKGPSMHELAWNKAQSQFGGMNPQQTGIGSSPWSSLGSKPTGFQPQATGIGSSPWASLNGKPQSPVNGSSSTSTGISDIASSFAIDSSKSSNNDFLSQFGSLSVNTSTNTGTGTGTGTNTTSPLTSQFGSISSNPTGSTSPGGFIQPQPTGFGGSSVKRFQPTSSFGSQLMENLPPVSESNGPGQSTSPPPSSSQQTFNPQSTGSGSSSQFGLGNTSENGLQGQGTGSQGLQNQPTGMPNPFRQSTMFGGGGMSALPRGSTGGSGAFGPGSPFAGQNQQVSQQPFGGFGQSSPWGQPNQNQNNGQAHAQSGQNNQAFFAQQFGSAGQGSENNASLI